ncbi:MAG: DUF3488 domain-containing protein [Verrucomicrobia bacterium]|nr:DUF3488 domain-containing protein [Verrucomicrobiota bacterium]
MSSPPPGRGRPGWCWAASASGAAAPLAAVVTLSVLLRPRLPSRLPRVVHTLAFPVILGCFALDLWLDPELLPSLVRLGLLLLSYRNLGYRGRREDLQLIVLGLFLVIVAGVLSVSPTFAVHLLLHGGCALGMLLVLRVRPGAARRRAPAWRTCGARPRGSGRAPSAPASGAGLRWSTPGSRCSAGSSSPCWWPGSRGCFSRSRGSSLRAGCSSAGGRPHDRRHFTSRRAWAGACPCWARTSACGSAEVRRFAPPCRSP